METFCPKCHKKYIVSDSLANKKARCKNDSCQEVFTIATIAPMPAPAPTPATPLAASKVVDGHASSSLSDLPSSLFDELPQADVAPVVLTNYKAPRPKGKSFLAKNAFALKLGGGIVAVLIVGCLLVMLVVSLLNGGGIPDWATYYIPENAQLIAYVNLDNVHKSDLYPEISKLVDKRAMQLEGDFGIEDVSEAFLAGSGFGPNDEPLAVIRTKTDLSLKDFLPKDRREQPTRSFRSIEYAGLGSSFGREEKMVAKTGDRTFCFAPNEDALKQAIGRLDRKERVKLDQNLQTVVDAVAGGDLYFAGIHCSNAQMPFPVEMFHVRASVASSVQAKATVVFADPDHAKKCKEMIDAVIDRARTTVPPEHKQEIEPLLSGVSTRQYGKELRCEMNWRNQDIMVLMFLVSKAKEQQSAFPGPPDGNRPIPSQFGPGAAPVHRFATGRGPARERNREDKVQLPSAEAMIIGLISLSPPIPLQCPAKWRRWLRSHRRRSQFCRSDPVRCLRRGYRRPC